MDAFEIDALITACRQSGRRYLEFTLTPSMSAGMFMLPADAVDDHQPHTCDELYHVVRGRGVLQVQGEDREVTEGSVVFVAAGVEHHFHAITEELAMLVFFGGEVV
jgi:quercetin dioxygenase-like cupin family protein